MSQEINNELIDTMLMIANNKVESAKYDKTTYAVLKLINGNTATITINGSDQTAKILNGINVNVGDTVIVSYLQNNQSNKLIIGKEGIAGSGSPTSTVTSVAGRTGDIILTNSDVGLGNVTNDAQVKRSEMGIVNGVATLDASGINVQPPKSHTHVKTDITDFPSSLPASGGNADTVDNLHATDFATSSQGIKADNALPSANYTANDILTKLKTVDGSGSGVDADLLDAQNGTYYLSRNNHTGTQTSSTISDFASAVVGTLLTGLSTATNTVISVTDSILIALGKLQKQISDNLTTLTNHTGNTNNPHSVTKSQVGLENVDNTSDVNKPVSTAQQTVLDSKANIASPVLTGTPTAPTPTTTDSSTNIATTAFVKAQGYITSSQAGTIITVSGTQPTGSKTGDIWIQTF